jgi:type II secretory pathway pseudopilin PulG
MRPTAKQRTRAGFTLVGVLILVAILAVIATATVSAGATLERRAAEEELLFVGRQYRNAFKSYYESAISTQRFPSKLEDLLKDPRFPGVRRHLRKLYLDPMTGKAQWGTVAAPGGGIMGVYSLSTEVPIKQALFPTEFTAFEGKQTYADWVFAYVAPAAQAAPAAGTPGAPVTPAGPAGPAAPANPGAAVGAGAVPAPAVQAGTGAAAGSATTTP